MLGAGLVEVPPVPYRDPASAIMTDPRVPEHRRHCSACGEPVGRSRNGRPGRTEGFCSKCGAAYSYSPKLGPGDLVGGQYEVLGCLAHGGLGWIYLARDRNVSDRWVVLKGLLDSQDPDAMDAALAERRFLAQVEHPNIVRIHNFVRHGGSGYIVMEYAGGRSLKDMVVERRRGTGERLPLPQVIAYALEALTALGYLHDQGLVFCDFKPDNAIHTEEQLKLIDLGGVRRIEDDDGPIYGTVGYQAPEIAAEGPSVSSDLYTVARAMAVMSFDFSGYTGRYEHTLPPRHEVDLLARYESYDRLLRRAAHPDPEERFWSAAEMAGQLTGVLREVLAAEDGQPRPAPSALFGPELRPVGVRGGRAPAPGEVALALPMPLVDGADPAAGFLAGLSAAAPADVLVALAQPPVDSPELHYRLARAHLELGDAEQARDALAGADGDWRVGWYMALAELVSGDPRRAAAGFDRVYGLLPGEAAPRLALGFSAEASGDPVAAGTCFEAVWRTDHSYTSAAFGLARARLAQGDRDGAVEVLASVPATSSLYADAQVAAVTSRLRGRGVGEPSHRDVLDAAARLDGLQLPEVRRERLAALILEAALGRVLTGGNGHGQGRNSAILLRAASGERPVTGQRGVSEEETVLGAALTEGALRLGLARTYRTLARLATGRLERIALMDRANAVRPRTLV